MTRQDLLSKYGLSEEEKYQKPTQQEIERFNSFKVKSLEDYLALDQEHKRLFKRRVEWAFHHKSLSLLPSEKEWEILNKIFYAIEKTNDVSKINIFDVASETFKTKVYLTEEEVLQILCRYVCDGWEWLKRHTFQDILDTYSDHFAYSIRDCFY